MRKEVKKMETSIHTPSIPEVPANVLHIDEKTLNEVFDATESANRDSDEIKKIITKVEDVEGE
ncbi:MAG: hypothetical protein D6734_09495 [Candidatus Schekmanbacteria bacterium]|nr:MAG: hypothetical protein D6734_09495 [Candidatus Schekmanbacteria bacterium]